MSTTMATIVTSIPAPHHDNNNNIPCFSPASSASNTLGNGSPTSPRQAHNFFNLQPHPATRQLRPPKSPLYVPAVLRPTERPSRPSPLTPPRSVRSSIDSLPSTLVTSVVAGSRPSTPSPPAPIITSISRSSTRSSTGPSTPTSITYPTRRHWKPDSQAVQCDAPGCYIAFSIIVRRHHCRRCGGIFCGTHAAQQVPLDERAELDEDGAWSRSCDGCYIYWSGIRGSLKMGKRSMEDDGDGSNSTTGAIPVGGMKGQGTVGTDEGEAKATAASVPKDWSWSTF